ncbi:hypothetical protein B7C42_00213 [Nocardia cerradoensis]|uniref:Uncharacterized protein n=1 Tax=Nocardia cerradoensis TaxID=85688 RepID=A0A231HDT5_9NOCA|nr:hypothetical protein [Nocardia cerradoensis]OXR47091.1 hypothetical protein B7C42_00213 [Nocardia cerradoensis]
MREKFQNAQPNSGEAIPYAEANHDREQRLAWDVSEALLQAVYDAAERTGEDARSVAVTVALQQVERTHAFDVSNEDDQHVLAAQANYVADRLIELIDAYDELTTSDLQGAIEALALRLVHHQLPVGRVEQTEGGDHE